MSCAHLVFCAPRVPVSARKGDEGPYPFLRAGSGGVRCDAYLFLRFAHVGGRWSFVGQARRRNGYASARARCEVG